MGRKIGGFHLMDGISITGDFNAHVLAWRGKDVQSFMDECVRLRVEFSDGIIYNIGF